MRADGRLGRLKYIETCRATFIAEEFKKLEELGSSLRNEKTKFTEGLWMLPQFYEGFTPPKKSTDQEFQIYLGRLDKWEKQFPDSLIIPVARGHLYIDWAWQKRGSGFSKTVTDDGWKGFKENLEKAKEVLTVAKAKGKVCPEWYSAMLVVGLGQGWSLEEYDKTFDEAVALEPTYYDYYFRKAYFLLPRWHGESGDVEDFCLATAKRFGADEGKAIYARTLWSVSDFYDDLFVGTKFQWPLMREGFQSIIKSTPDSLWNLTHFVRFAFKAQDKETVRELIPFWEEKYKKQNKGVNLELPLIKSWVENRAQAIPKWSHQLKSRSKDEHSFDVSPDGKLVAAVSSRQDFIYIINRKTGNLLMEFDALMDEVAEISYSPDGSTIALLGESREEAGKKMLLVLKTDSLKVHQQYVMQDTGQLSFGFAKKSSRIFFDEKVTGKSSTLKTLSLETGKVETVWESTSDDKKDFRVVAISPDEKILVMGTNRELQAFELVSGKELSKPFLLRGYFTAGLFSESGDRFIAISGDWPDKGTFIDQWNTQAWQQEPDQSITTIFNSRSLDLSKDGKWILVGSDDGSASLIDRVTGEQKHFFYPNKGKIRRVKFLDNPEQLGFLTESGHLSIWKYDPLDQGMK